MAAQATAERIQGRPGAVILLPALIRMITIYHNLDPEAPRRGTDPAWKAGRLGARELELAAVVWDTDDLAEAFDRVIHRDGENWTDNEGVTFFGDPRGRRSSQEGDVFVTSAGLAHLVLPLGFRALPGLRLPFVPDGAKGEP